MSLRSSLTSLRVGTVQVIRWLCIVLGLAFLVVPNSCKAQQYQLRVQLCHETNPPSYGSDQYRVHPVLTVEDLAHTPDGTYSIIVTSSDQSGDTVEGTLGG